MQHTVIEIRNEQDIGNAISILLQGKALAFTIPMYVNREEHFRLMNVMNTQYKAVVANNNTETAQAA